MENGELQEAILVAVDHSNIQGGSFMTDSSVSGHWESAFIQDIIPYIDGKYRTIAERESRGLFGHSMGGRAALNFGMSYPELFNALYAFSPALIRDEDFEELYKSEMRKKILGSSFAPDPSAEPPYQMPKFDGTKEDAAIIDKYLDGIGHIDERVAAYLQKDKQLAMIGFEVGSNEPAISIIEGCKYFAQVLEANDIPYMFYYTDSYHSISNEVVCDRAIPLLMQYLRR